MIEEPIAEHLDLYFRQCSILVTARDLAVMAATLANNGINPVTREQAIANEQVSSMLSVMASCGMYDFSGEWLYRVGLPAKSGVGGGIIAVLPGQFGIGIFSPRLDERGNSVRGINVCQELSEHFRLHLFDTHRITDAFVCRTYTGAVVSSKRQRRQWQRSLLTQIGHAIVVYELQGDLYFTTIEKLNRSLQQHEGEITFLILDGRRISYANSSALTLLEQLRQWFANQEIRLLLSGFSPAICGELQTKGWPEADFFPNLDAALEWSENRLLSTFEPAVGQRQMQRLSLTDMDIFERFSEAEIATIATFIQEAYYQQEQFIIREGETADRLFLLAAGTVTVSLQLPDNGQRKRLTTYIPGMAFGELILFESSKRTADVIADSEVNCYVLTIDHLQELQSNYPDIYIKLLRTFGKNLMETLRRATNEIRILAGG
jgi:glutaminase